MFAHNKLHDGMVTMYAMIKIRDPKALFGSRDSDYIADFLMSVNYYNWFEVEYDDKILAHHVVVGSQHRERYMDKNSVDMYIMLGMKVVKDGLICNLPQLESIQQGIQRDMCNKNAVFELKKEDYVLLLGDFEWFYGIVRDMEDFAEIGMAMW